MKFSDAAKSSMIEFHSIFPTFGSFLNHTFLTNGNGLSWKKDGTLSDEGEQTKLAELPAIERIAATGGSTYQPPADLEYALNIETIPADIQNRINDPFIDHLCDISRKYSEIFSLPDNVQPDYLDAAIALLIIANETPLECFSAYKSALQETKFGNEEKKQKAQTWVKRAEKEYEQGIAEARKFIGELRQRFPNHVWTNPMGKIVLDANRPDVPGSPKAWPVSGEPLTAAQMKELVAEFEAAIHFAYNVTPKDNATPLSKTLEGLAKDAAKMGRYYQNKKVMESYKVESFLEKPPSTHVIETTIVDQGYMKPASFRKTCSCGWYSVMFDYGYRENQAKNEAKEHLAEHVDPFVKFLKKEKKKSSPTRFDSMLDPVLENIRSQFDFVRKNEGADIPYNGYPIGRESRACCLDISYAFTAGSLEYNLDDQGRDALEVIVGSLITVAAEQGRRLYTAELQKVLETSAFGKETKADEDRIYKLMRSREEKPREKAQREAVTARIRAALDSFVFSGDNATVLSTELPTMPQVDVVNPVEEPINVDPEVKQRLIELMAQLER